MDIFVDNFAGGGGASTGIEMAIGHSVDIAINHDPDAIAMHKANHPMSKHYCEDVWQVDPVEACGDNSVALAWFSPDCKHFSRAKGAKPVDKNIRGLAWVAVKWAYTVRPKVIMLENVPEIQTWGPVGSDNRPIKERAGETFDGFIRALSTGVSKFHPAYEEMCNALQPSLEMKRALQHGLGYNVEYRTLKSCDYGAPTTRTRFYLIARCDGKDIIWPEPTHAPKYSEEVRRGLKQPYHTVAECIDWSIPSQSIFDRNKPLADNTLRRIARGIQKYVISNPEPFIVNYKFDNEPKDVDEPLSTITAVNNHYLVTPYITPIGYGEKKGQAPRVNSVEEPLGTCVTSGKHYLTAPVLIQYHSETREGKSERAERVGTIDDCRHSPRYALAVADLLERYGVKNDGTSGDIKIDEPEQLTLNYIMTMRNNMDGQAVDEPLTTVSCSGAHHAEVQAFLVKYYSGGTSKPIDEPLDTVTTRDRFALVTVNNEEYVISDIRMRMLQPRELFNAQGFPHDYIIDHDFTGHEYSKTKQVARCGNAVTPQVPEALVRANLPEYCTKLNKASGF